MQVSVVVGVDAKQWLCKGLGTFLAGFQTSIRDACLSPSMMAVPTLRGLVEARVQLWQHRDGVSMKAEFDVDGGVIDDVLLLTSYIKRGIW